MHCYYWRVYNAWWAQCVNGWSWTASMHYFLRRNAVLPLICPVQDERPCTTSLHFEHCVGVFFRGFASRSLAIVRKTFTTYIHPILEYNSNVCNPSHKYLIDQLENFQRKFTKWVTSVKNYSYLARLVILWLEPLELRRLRCDLMQ